MGKYDFLGMSEKQTDVKLRNGKYQVRYAVITCGEINVAIKN